MKKAKGLKKRYYMLRDLLGISSKKYNYKNNYTYDKNSQDKLSADIIDLDAIYKNGYTNIIYSYFNSGETFYLANYLLNLPEAERKKYKFISTLKYNKGIFEMYNISDNFMYGKIQDDKINNIADQFFADENFIKMPITKYISSFFNLKENLEIKKPIISENTKNKIDNFLKNKKNKKILFISPESQSLGNLSNNDLEFIIDKYTKLNYNIIINSQNKTLQNFQYLEDWKINNCNISICFFNFDETYYLVSQCDEAICVRSGLIDILASIESCKFIILYNFASEIVLNKFSFNKIYNTNRFIELRGCNINLLRYLDDINKIYKW